MYTYLYIHISNAHARVFRHRALPWLLCAEVFPARIVYVLHQHTHNGSILDTCMLATWPKIGQKLVPKEVKVVPNWVQNRCLAGPDAPTRTEAPTANSRPRFWTLFGVPFGWPLEAKFAFKFNLEAIRKEYAFCTPKNTSSEAVLVFIFKLLEWRFDRHNIALTKQHAK